MGRDLAQCPLSLQPTLADTVCFDGFLNERLFPRSLHGFVPLGVGGKGQDQVPFPPRAFLMVVEPVLTPLPCHCSPPVQVLGAARELRAVPQG